MASIELKNEYIGLIQAEWNVYGKLTNASITLC